MDFHSISIKIIFDKIIEEFKCSDKNEIITFLYETFENINKKMFSSIDFDKLGSLLLFLGEDIKNNVIDLINNSTNKRIYISKFLRISCEISMIGKDINSDEYISLNEIILESDKILNEEIYVENKKIDNISYIIAINFLKCKNDEDYIKTIIDSLYNPDFNLINSLIDNFEKINKENEILIDIFLTDFIKMVGFTKSLFGIEKGKSVTKEPIKCEPVIEKVIEIKPEIKSESLDEKNLRIMRIINKYKTY